MTVFAGSEDDLVDRHYRAAEKFHARYVVRIPADNPTPQSSEIDKIIEHHLRLGTVGFSSNLAEVFGSRYPDGIGAEIFDFELLEESWKNETNPKKREHVHLNFFDYGTQIPVDSDWCPVSTVQCPEEFARPDLILDVNTLQQYRYMAQLYEDLYRKDIRFSIQEIIAWHDKLESLQKPTEG